MLPSPGGHQQRRGLGRFCELFLLPLQLSGPDYRLVQGEKLVLGQCLLKEKLVPESPGLWARFGPGLTESISSTALLMSSVLYRCS